MEPVSPEEQPAKRESAAGVPLKFYGKHRLAAAVSHLHNEIELIQKEIDQLDGIGESSLVCHELISSVEAVPDPLLPMTRSGGDWDRWFKGTHNSTSHKRWI